MSTPAVNAIDALALPVLATSDVGAAGAAAVGVTLFDGADEAVCQLFRVAVAVKVYAAPIVRPVTLQDELKFVTTHCFDASWVALMVYHDGAPKAAEIGLAVTLTVAAPLPGLPAAAVGAEGFAGGAGEMSGMPPVTVGVIFHTLFESELEV